MANVRSLGDLFSDAAMEGQRPDIVYVTTPIFGDVTSTAVPPLVPHDKVHFLHVLSPWFKFLSATSVILVVTTIVYIATLAYDFDSSDALTPKLTTLNLFGSNIRARIAEGEVWRLFTAMFLHGSGIHILGNMLFLVSIGFALEERYGTPVYLASYVFFGMAAVLFSDMFSLTIISVGASTSILGLYGIFTGEIIFFWEHIPSKYLAAYLTTLSILFVFIFTTLVFSHVDVAGHVGGFLYGLLLTPLLNYKHPKKPRWYKFGIAIGVILTLTLLGVSSGLMWGRPNLNSG